MEQSANTVTIPLSYFNLLAEYYYQGRIGKGDRPDELPPPKKESVEIYEPRVPTPEEVRELEVALRQMPAGYEPRGILATEEEQEAEPSPSTPSN